jgi:hypothetical protein
MTKNLVFNCETATITGTTKFRACIEADGVEMGPILDEFTVEEIVKYFDHGLLLDAIGEDEIREYFEIN